jgi:uncharacterized protein HemY
LRLTPQKKNNPFDTAGYVRKSIADSSLSNAALGYLAFKKKHWSEAIAFFKRSMELRTDFAEASWYVSKCYDHWGDRNKAEEFLRRAQERGKNWALDE